MSIQKNEVYGTVPRFNCYLISLFLVNLIFVTNGRMELILGSLLRNGSLVYDSWNEHLTRFFAMLACWVLNIITPFIVFLWVSRIHRSLRLEKDRLFYISWLVPGVNFFAPALSIFKVGKALNNKISEWLSIGFAAGYLASGFCLSVIMYNRLYNYFIYASAGREEQIWEFNWYLIYSIGVWCFFMVCFCIHIAESDKIKYRFSQSE